ncbi:hypothetical protein BD309DRAFT_960637 [Dichomitus squalens]|nr:hypothetical protein BD309DRAFT_960637 [Dichomitus squalens]
MIPPINLCQPPIPFPRTSASPQRSRTYFDVTMLVIVHASKRTSLQFEQVLAESGFKINRVFYTRLFLITVGFPIYIPVRDTLLPEVIEAVPLLDEVTP